MELDLGVSTVGKRRDQSDADCPIEVTTSKVLQRLEIDSPFFEQNPPRPLPSFSPEGMFSHPSKWMNEGSLLCNLVLVQTAKDTLRLRLFSSVRARPESLTSSICLRCLPFRGGMPRPPGSGRVWCCDGSIGASCP